MGMKRSLALLTLLIVTSFVLAGNASAAAERPSLKGIFAISGNSAFLQTKKDQLIVRNLRTGAVRRASFPSNAAPGDSVIRVNSHAVASVTGWSESKLVLQLNGVGLKPRVLATLDRYGACGLNNDMRVLQLDTNDTVTAIRTVEVSAGNLCDSVSTQSYITKYFRNGSTVDVEIPAALRPRISSNAALALRGNTLLVPGGYGLAPISTLLDIRTGRVIWEGQRPSSGEASLPTPGVIWSARDYFGRSSRVYLFNYKTLRAVTIRIPHPRTGQPCGKFTLFASGPALEIYDIKGRLVRKARARAGDPYGYGQNICSGNFAVVPHLNGKPELIDLTRIR